MRFSFKVAIPLMTLSMPMIANASSGFYVSASSLFGQQKTTEVQTGTATLTKSVSKNVNRNGVVFTKPTLTKSVVSADNNSTRYSLGSSSTAYLDAIDNLDNKYISETVKMQFAVDNGNEITAISYKKDGTTVDTTTTQTVDTDYWHNFLYDDDWTSVEIKPTNYATNVTTLQTDIKKDIAALTPQTREIAATKLINNAIGGQKGGFEASIGYKFHNPNSVIFFAPQLDYSRFQFGSKMPEALSVVGKAGLEWKNASVYGFAGISGVQNSNVSGKNSTVLGLKYGAGVEIFVHKNIALFTEVFRIDLNNSLPSTTTASTSTNTYATSGTVEDYMTANNGGGTIVVTNTTTADTFTLNKLELSDYIDVNSVTYQTTDKLTNFTKTSSSTFITSIVGFKTGVTVYFGNDNNDNYYYGEAKF